jgi:hypothetical protein
VLGKCGHCRRSSVSWSGVEYVQKRVRFCWCPGDCFLEVGGKGVGRMVERDIIHCVFVWALESMVRYALAFLVV